jgi:glucosamine-6-phosphate deaminase
MNAFRADSLTAYIHENSKKMAAAAATAAAAIIVDSIEARGLARVILATAVSQVEFYESLVSCKAIDWSRIIVFHMDEFLGIPESHSASFGRFLNQYLLTRIPVRAAHKIRGDALQPLRECARYEALLKESQIDLCCLGVGENGHIAFNDPDVADFEEKSWVKLVKMDDRCRLQQVKDKVFNTINDVPSYAYTLTIPALMSARQIVGIVPGSHKAEAVAKMLQNPVSTTCPASALRHHPKAELHLDAHAAERLLIA